MCDVLDLLYSHFWWIAWHNLKQLLIACHSFILSNDYDDNIGDVGLHAVRVESDFSGGVGFVELAITATKAARFTAPLCV